MGLITLQDIFQLGYADYEQAHPLPASLRKAARAIMTCRTAALGGHVQACPDGHFSRIWSNSCRHRSCPQCAFIQVERWLAVQRARLLTCDHYHAIFTLPHDLNPLWLGNVSLLTTVLFQTVRETLVTLLADPKYLGAQPGILAALRTAWERGALQLPDELRPQAFLNLLNRLGHPKKTRWNVHIQTRYPHGTGVATYLARSMRGGPIKNTRLVACDGKTVTFRYVDNHAASGDTPAPTRQMTLPVGDFLHRVLQHVPPPGTQVVRSWGLYHPRHAAALDVCRTQLGQPPVVLPQRQDWQTVCAQRGDVHPECCPTCGQLLVCTAMIPRAGVSPPPRPAERAA